MTIAEEVLIKGGEIAAKKGIQELLRPQIVRPLKEPMAVRLAASIQVDNIPEKQVNDALEEIQNSTPNETGLLPQGMKTVKAGYSDFAYQISSYGSVDQFDEDNLEEFTTFFDDYDSPVEDMVPTISSISVFVYPVNLTYVYDIEKGFALLERLVEGITSRVPNKGVKRYVLFMMAQDKLPALLKLATKVSKEASPFKDSQDRHGVQLASLDSLHLKRFLDEVVGQFGTPTKRIAKIAKDQFNSIGKK